MHFLMACLIAQALLVRICSKTTSKQIRSSNNTTIQGRKPRTSFYTETTTSKTKAPNQATDTVSSRSQETTGTQT